MLRKAICAVVCMSVLLAEPLNAYGSLGYSDASADATESIDTQIKSQWITVDNDTYYFKGNGEMATLSCKIKGTYYVFDCEGRLLKPSTTKIVKVALEDGTYKKYQVNPEGKAVKGWSKDKKYYFYENGEMVTGIEVFNEKFYCFNANGKYNATKTKKLRKAAVYEKDFTALKKLIGAPKKAKYYVGCYGNGKDGILTYEKFIVYTFKSTNGKEIFMGAE